MKLSCNRGNETPDLVDTGDTLIWDQNETQGFRDRYKRYWKTYPGKGIHKWWVMTLIRRVLYATFWVYRVQITEYLHHSVYWQRLFEASYIRARLSEFQHHRQHETGGSKVDKPFVKSMNAGLPRGKSMGEDGVDGSRGIKPLKWRLLEIRPCIHLN